MSAAPGTIRSALRHRHFRRLLAALAVSQAGDWLYNLALLALVFDRTHSTTWLAVTTAARVSPIVLLGPVGGVLADRWDRRTVMIASDAIRTLCMLGLALVAATGLPIGLAPLLAAVSTAASSPYPACAAATTPRLVDDADLPGANAARSAVGMLCIVAGPGFGAVLLLLGSPTMAFVANAATFVISALAVASIPAGPVFRPGASGERAASVFADIAAGAAELRRHVMALWLVGADVTCSVVYGAQTVLLLLLAGRLGLGAAGYGYLLASFGVGGVIATLFAGRVAASRRPRLTLLAAMTSVAVPATLMAVTPCLPGALTWGVLIGAGSVIVEVSTETTLQRSLPEDVFARAYGVALPAALGGIVLGSLIAAPLADAFGLTGALAAVGALAGCYVVALLVATARRTAAVASTEPADLPVAVAA